MNYTPRWPHFWTIANNTKAMELWRKHVNARTEEFDAYRLRDCITQGLREARICGATKGLIDEMRYEKGWVTHFAKHCCGAKA